MSFCPNAYYDELDDLRTEVCNLGDTIQGPEGDKGPTGNTTPVVSQGIPTGNGQQGEMRISKDNTNAYLYIFDQGSWHTIEFGPDAATFTVAWATAGPTTPTIQLSDFDPALDTDTVIQIKKGGVALSVTVAKNTDANTATVTGNFGNAENVTVVVNGSEKPLAKPFTQVRATASANGEALAFSRNMTGFAGHNETVDGVAYTIDAAGAISPPLLQGKMFTIPTTGVTDTATAFGLEALGITTFTFANQSTYTLPTVTLAAAYDGTNITVTPAYPTISTAVDLDTVESLAKITYNTNTIPLTTNATFRIQLRDTEIVLDNGHTVAVNTATDVVNNAPQFGVAQTTHDAGQQIILIAFESVVSDALFAQFQYQFEAGAWTKNNIFHDAEDKTVVLIQFTDLQDGQYNFRFDGHSTTLLPNVPAAFSYDVTGADIIDGGDQQLAIQTATISADGMQLTVTTNYAIDHNHADYGSPSIRVDGTLLPTTQQTQDYKSFTLTGFQRILKDQQVFVVPSNKWSPITPYVQDQTEFTIRSLPENTQFFSINNSEAEVPTVIGHAVVRATDATKIDLALSVPVTAAGDLQLKIGNAAPTTLAVTDGNANLVLTAATNIVYAPDMSIIGLSALKAQYDLPLAIDTVPLHFAPVLQTALWKDETTIKMTFNSPVTDAGTPNVVDKDGTIVVSVLPTNVQVSVANGLYHFNGVAANTRQFALISGVTYTFSEIPTGHPMALVGDGLNVAGTSLFNQRNGNSYYTGTISVIVDGVTGVLSLDCWYHGAMGGTNAVVLTSPLSTNVEIQSAAFDPLKAPYRLTNVDSMQNSIGLPVSPATFTITNLTITTLAITAASVHADGTQITATLNEDCTASTGLRVVVDGEEVGNTPTLTGRTLVISVGVVILQGQVVQLQNLDAYLTPRAAIEGEKMVGIASTYSVTNASTARVPQVVGNILVDGASVSVTFDVAMKNENLNDLRLVNAANATQYTFPTQALTDALLTLTSDTPIAWNGNMFLRDLRQLKSAMNVSYDVEQLPVHFIPTPTGAVFNDVDIQLTFNSPVNAPTNPSDIQVFNGATLAATVNTILVQDNILTLQTNGAWEPNIIYTVKGLTNVSNSIGIASALDEIQTVDTKIPVITLNGANPLEVELGSGNYSDPGFQTDDGTAVVTGGQVVNTNALGTYTITYNATDASGNAAVQKTRTVQVVDTTAPAIALKTEFVNTTVEKGGVFVPAAQTDVTVTDLTPPITVNVSGTVDVNTVEAYTITYTATDGVGNEATLTRTVQVVDTTPPVITLNGANPLEVELGSGNYVDPGATTDDGTPVVTGGTVNTNAVGTYTITYDATDGEGNAAVQQTRTVQVVDTTAPVLTLIRNNTVPGHVFNDLHQINLSDMDTWDENTPYYTVTDNGVDVTATWPRTILTDGADYPDAHAELPMVYIKYPTGFSGQQAGTLQSLENTNYTIEYKAFDAAGNASFNPTRRIIVNATPQVQHETDAAAADPTVTATLASNGQTLELFFPVRMKVDANGLLHNASNLEVTSGGTAVTTTTLQQSYNAESNRIVYRLPIQASTASLVVANTNQLQSVHGTNVAATSVTVTNQSTVTDMDPFTIVNAHLTWFHNIFDATVNPTILLEMNANFDFPNANFGVRSGHEAQNLSMFTITQNGAPVTPTRAFWMNYDTNSIGQLDQWDDDDNLVSSASSDYFRDQTNQKGLMMIQMPDNFGADDVVTVAFTENSAVSLGRREGDNKAMANFAAKPVFNRLGYDETPGGPTDVSRDGPRIITASMSEDYTTVTAYVRSYGNTSLSTESSTDGVSRLMLISLTGDNAADDDGNSNDFWNSKTLTIIKHNGVWYEAWKCVKQLGSSGIVGVPTKLQDAYDTATTHLNTWRAGTWCKIQVTTNDSIGWSEFRTTLTGSITNAAGATARLVGPMVTGFGPPAKEVDDATFYNPAHPHSFALVPLNTQMVTITNAANYTGPYAEPMFTKTLTRQSLVNDRARTGYCVGDRVNAYWEASGTRTRYPCTVFAVNDNDLTIHWDDGSSSQQTHPFVAGAPDLTPTMLEAFTIPPAVTSDLLIYVEQGAFQANDVLTVTVEKDATVVDQQLGDRVRSNLTFTYNTYTMTITTIEEYVGPKPIGLIRCLTLGQSLRYVGQNGAYKQERMEEFTTQPLMYLDLPEEYVDQTNTHA